MLRNGLSLGAVAQFRLARLPGNRRPGGPHRQRSMAGNIPGADGVVREPPSGRRGARCPPARACVDAYRESGAVPPRERHALNRILAEAPVVRRIEDGWELSLLPVKRGIQSVLAEIVASLADMLAKGEPSRVKICENPDCGWVIYDESRNRTRRWCSATECGNLIKVRRHRSRRRHAVE
jgi:hypothetical protein